MPGKASLIRSRKLFVKMLPYRLKILQLGEKLSEKRTKMINRIHFFKHFVWGGNVRLRRGEKKIRNKNV